MRPISIAPCPSLAAGVEARAEGKPVNPYASQYDTSSWELPTYAKEGNFNITEVRKYLKEKGAKSRLPKNPDGTPQEPPPVDPAYQQAFDRVFKDNSPGAVEALTQYGVQFHVPEGYRFVDVIGAGEKGVVIGLERAADGKAFAMKLPLTAKKDKNGQVKNDRGDLTQNLELEVALNAYLREHITEYGINTLALHAAGSHGTFMVTERFAGEASLGEKVQSLIMSGLNPVRRQAYEQALQNGDRAKIGEVVKDGVKEFMPQEMLRELQSTFEGAQRLALRTGMNIDLVSDNLAVLGGRVVLFDVGIRTTDGSSAQKYTVGEAYTGAGSPLLTFDGWLEIMHMNWLARTGKTTLTNAHTGEVQGKGKAP